MSLRTLAAIIAFAASVAGVGLSADLPFAVRGEMSGVASVVDGDGLAIAGVEVRLQGIAAPENNAARIEVGGKDATRALERLSEGKWAICYLDGTTTRGRPVGVCYIAGEDVGEVMVREGFARDCPRYSKGRYADAEGQAISSGRNLSLIYPLPRYC